MRVMVVVLALMLAGCSQGGQPAEEDDGFEEVEVDESTGAIRGVVVDASIVPVAEATVVLQGLEPVEKVTDEEGRFSFSKIEPGTYFLTAEKPLHESVQFSAEVLAGVKEPAIIKVQLPRLFEGDPYMQPFSADGYFTCSQAGVPGYGYGSSPCHSTTTIDLSDYGVVLDQERDFHADVNEGWQTMVFEMKWEASARGTSERMGLVVSTYKPERPTNHWFANVASGDPMRFQLDVGEPHATAQQGSGEHDAVPPEGLKDMSFFASVRCPSSCIPPGLSLEQRFTVYMHQFVYLPAPEGWSIVAGDGDPF